MFLLPIEKDNPTLSPARVVQAVIVINVLVFIAELFGDRTQIFRQFGFISTAPQIHRAFSHMFLHGGFLHLLGNMFFLWMFGDNVEDVLGRVTFSGAYVACGLGALVAQYTSDPHSAVPMVGASGAISGVVALYLAFFPKAPFELAFYFGRWEVGSKSVSCKVAVIAWFLEQLVLATVTSLTHSIGIAFWAHVGGFVTGGIIGLVAVQLGYKVRFETRAAALIPARGKRKEAAASA